jgi:hypothetical protein
LGPLRATEIFKKYVKQDAGVESGRAAKGRLSGLVIR